MSLPVILTFVCGKMNFISFSYIDEEDMIVYVFSKLTRAGTKNFGRTCRNDTFRHLVKAVTSLSKFRNVYVTFIFFTFFKIFGFYSLVVVYYFMHCFSFQSSTSHSKILHITFKNLREKNQWTNNSDINNKNFLTVQQINSTILTLKKKHSRTKYFFSFSYHFYEFWTM